MPVREVPTQYEYTCDGCGAKETKANKSRPAYWTGLNIEADAYDYQGCACADASVKRLLCRECTTVVHAAVNASITERKAQALAKINAVMAGGEGVSHVSEAVERVHALLSAIEVAEAGTDYQAMADADLALYEELPTLIGPILAEIARLTEQVRTAREVARDYGSTDGSHHKMWVIDQMVRALTGDDYAAWVAEHNDGENGPDTYEWDEGIAP